MKGVFMRIFVTGTGRCGSVTFSKACQHITNYTSSHETDWRKGPASLLNYPDNHIEVSAHLVYFIPNLRKRYPDAKWVHLIRERDRTIASLSKRCGTEMSWFSYQWWGLKDSKQGATIFYDATNALCNVLLPDAMKFHLEQAADQFPIFWKWIDAEGNLNAALAEFSIKYNAYV